ncbi:response regulator [Aliifodinibius sp. S!AR15-10]|uniref:histidine kinase dimerization/phosphoacceptor domain -containing protein n=1 Tax=Aliifodinibius sp. S!AR15-10 TaxID=2950437 RepID=UPI002865C659|nr:histidine kinase dimerization/phosphoacceptor domain -containing protein [Aliifodinibius sp. S!AR15-10]MDR8391267.1 response regulator [Aliifodinibius sp. S!AR15-10]
MGNPEKLSILVLEDTVTDFDLLRYQLKSDGLEPDLHHAKGREHFLEHLDAHLPNLVIADYNLPSFNGLDALKIVKSKNPLLPFILLSGSIDKEQERAILREGADDVIFKSNLSRIPFAIKRSIKDAQDKKKLRETTEKLEASLREKEILIQEIHHRVKNNLALVSGLLELKKFNSEEKKEYRFINKVILKIKSIALVHETLYQSQNFSQIDFNHFLEELIEYLAQIYKSEEKDIEIKSNDFELSLNVNQAIPVGLIISELTMNSVQHAFDGRNEGQLEVKVVSEKDQQIKIKIADDGIGASDGFAPKQDGGYGSKIIRALLRQIDANVEVNNSEGTEYLISFEKKDVKGIGNALL